MTIENEIIRYCDLPFAIKPDKDPFGIAAMCSSNIQQVFLHNPQLINEDQTFAYFELVEGKYGGTAFFYPSIMKVGNELIEATGGSTLEVYEEYRHLALGADIVMYPIVNKVSNALIYAGLSSQALSLYKKTRFIIFAYPRMMLLRKSKSILRAKKFRGFLLKLTSTVIDTILRWFSLIEKHKIKTLKRKFRVHEVDKIPDFVEELVRQDSHKYAEYHSKDWFQWNLDYNLTGEPTDHQHFYIVNSATNDEPIGFFMTKERYRKTAGGSLQDIVVGSIVEWGSKNLDELSESTLNALALPTFSNKVDIIEFASADCDTISKMKRYGFIQHGNAHIAVKDLTKKYKDIKDINNWRIRFGYADVILT